LIAAVAPMIGRLVSSEIGAKPGSGRGLALAAFSFLLIYDFGRALAHQRALATLNSRIYRGGPPIQVAAFPLGFSNPFTWSGWIDCPEFVMQFSMNLLHDFDPASGRAIYKPEASPAIDAARSTVPVEKFLDFAQYPLWQVTPVADPEGAERVDVR